MNCAAEAPAPQNPTAPDIWPTSIPNVRATPTSSSTTTPVSAAPPSSTAPTPITRHANPYERLYPPPPLRANRRPVAKQRLDATGIYLPRSPKRKRHRHHLRSPNSQGNGIDRKADARRLDCIGKVKQNVKQKVKQRVKYNHL